METIEGKIKLLTNPWVYIWTQLAFVCSGTKMKFVSFTCILFSALNCARQKRKERKQKKSGKNGKDYLLYKLLTLELEKKK